MFFNKIITVWLIIIIIIEGLSLLQSIPPTTADKQTQAQKRRGSRSRKLLGGTTPMVHANSSQGCVKGVGGGGWCYWGK